MRNFSSEISQSCTYVLDQQTSFTDPAFVRVQKALMISMDANPDFMTPSEEGILADFIGWFMRCKNDAVIRGVAPSNPVFFYANLNSGSSIVVLWRPTAIDLVYRRCSTQKPVIG